MEMMRHARLDHQDVTAVLVKLRLRDKEVITWHLTTHSDYWWSKNLPQGWQKLEQKEIVIAASGATSGNYNYKYQCRLLIHAIENVIFA